MGRIRSCRPTCSSARDTSAPPEPSRRAGWVAEQQSQINVSALTRRMNALWLSLLFGAPWLAAIVYTWSRAPRMGGMPPSFADRTHQRLWA
jgi:hypothetical protein